MSIGGSSSNQTQSKGLALKFLSARRVGLKADDGRAARDVIDANSIEQVGSAARRDKFDKRIFRDCARAMLSGTANENALDGVADDFAGYAARPTNSGPSKRLPFHQSG